MSLRRTQLVLLVLFCAFHVVAQQPLNLTSLDPNESQRLGGHIVQRGESLSLIAKRYGNIDAWQLIAALNRENIPNPDRIVPGLSLLIPTAAQAARPMRFNDPDGRRDYPDYPWIEIPVGQQGSVTCSRDSGWEQAVVIYEVTGTASVAEYMRCGTNTWHNRNPERKLRGGNRYYFSAWHKKPDDPGAQQRHITNVPWSPSRTRLQVTSNGYRIEVDDNLAGPGYSRGFGDSDYNDTVVTVIIK